MPLATYRTLVGIAKEVTQGVPVAPVDFIPVTADPKPNIMQTYLADKGWRGSATALFGEVLGQRKAEISVDGNVDPALIGYQLQSVLGDVVTTGAAAPFTHAMSLLNTGQQQPGGYTITDYDGGQANQYAAARFSDLSIKFTADGLLSYTSKATCWAPAVYATALAPSFSAAQPIASWVGVAQIAGAGNTAIIDGTIDLKRTVEAIQTVDGNPDPYKMWSGLLAVTGKLNLIYEDQTAMTDYLTNVQPALDLIWTQGTSSLRLHMSKAAFVKGDVIRGKDYGTVSVTFDALANVTDVGASAGFSPIKATLINAKAAGTYV